MPSLASQFSFLATLVAGALSFLQQTWFSEGHWALSALIKTFPLILMPDFSLPSSLSKHWPFSTHLKPSSLNSGSEQSRTISRSWQHWPGCFAALGSFPACGGHFDSSAVAAIRSESLLRVRSLTGHLSFTTHLKMILKNVYCSSNSCLSYSNTVTKTKVI